MIYLFIYLLIGACWANIADEFVFKKTRMTTLHKIVSFTLWPLEIIIGGMSR
jgi:hypothetical protein